MSEEVTKNKKTKKWLLPVIIGAAVLVIAGIVLAIVLGGGTGNNTGGGTTKIESRLYWNLDREQFVDPDTGMSTRVKGSDGYFTVRFVADGEIVELKCKDKRTVNDIDFMSVVALTFDKDGIIDQVYDPKEAYTELGKDFFVRSYEDGMLIINSSISMNGMDVEAPITEKTGIYVVDPRDEQIGRTGTPSLLDKVSVYANENGETEYVFITSISKEAGLYFRIGSHYNSTEGMTKRVPNENGEYELLFAHEGEQVVLKCKNLNLVNVIDARYDANVIMGLLFDEEGYIKEVVSAAEAVQGKVLYTYYEVIDEVDGTYTLESNLSINKDIGTIATMTLPEGFDDIFLLEADCDAEFIGQRMEKLEVGDRVCVYSDFQGNPKQIMITRRKKVDSTMYFNITKKYDSTLKETTRLPDENGYYVFDVAGEGKRFTVRTKDKALATKIDMQTLRMFGMKYEGDIVKEVYGAPCVSGDSAFGDRVVTEIMGVIYRLATPGNFETGSNAMLSADCKIYDVTTGYKAKVGQETTLKLGDLVYAYRNSMKEANYIYVLKRYEEGTKVYENYSRKYDYTNLVTKREPDAEGYYVFDMNQDGEMVQVKTKDKDLATYLDSYTYLALRVENGIVKDAYDSIDVTQKFSTVVLSGTYFDSFNEDGTINYYKYTNGERVDSVTNYGIAEDAKIYNNTASYLDHRGELTKLEKNDYMYGLFDRQTRQITKMYVRTRKVDSPIYWPINRQYDSTNAVTKREPNEEGYYVFDLLEDGKIKQFKTKNKDLASRVDYYSTGFGMKVNGDIILQVYSATNINGIKAERYFHYDVMKIEGNNVFVERTEPTSASYGKTGEMVMSKDCKIYDVSSYAPVYGATETLGLGDRVVSFSDEKGEIVYCFITYKNTRKQGGISLCEHCGEVVQWKIYTGTIAAMDMHYYLPGDTVTRLRTIGYSQQLEENPDRKQYETVIDLNGFTLTADPTNDRIFNIYGTLSVLDSVGGGQIKATMGKGANIGKIALMNGPDATFNLYSGTLTAEESTVPLSTGGALIRATKGTVNIYGGTVTGGFATAGGNFYMNTDSTLNVYGGVISNGKATGEGGNIYATDGATINIEGGKVIGGSATTGDNVLIQGAVNSGVINVSKLIVNNMQLDGVVAGAASTVGTTEIELIGKVKLGDLELRSGTLINIAKMKTGSDVTVKTSGGTFTTESSEAASLLDCFKAHGKYDTIVPDVNKLVYNVGIIPPEELVTIGDEIAKTAAQMSFDNYVEGSAVYCPVCDKKVIWTALTEEKIVNGQVLDKETLLPYKVSGHYFLAEDIELENAADKLLQSSGNLCLHLNNKKLHTTGNTTAIYLSNFRNNIMGKGSVCGDHADGTLLITGAVTEVNLYGGTYTRMTNNAKVIGMLGWSEERTSKLNIYGNPNGDEAYGAIIDGSFASSKPAISVGDGYGMTLTMYGGVVKNGTNTGDSAGNISIGTGNGQGVSSEAYKDQGAIYDSEKDKWYIHRTGYNTFNMYGGLITGGTGGSGGNISTNGYNSCWGDGTNPIEGCDHQTHVNIYGGTISNGSAINGGNIYTRSSKLNITGGTIVGGYVTVNEGTITELVGTVNLPDGIELLNGTKLDITNMAADSNVTVLANGVFTTEREDIDDVKDCFSAENPEFEQIGKVGNALGCTVDLVAKQNFNAKTASEMSFDDYVAGEKKLCPACGAAVVWTAITNEGYGDTPWVLDSTNRLSGHYYLAEDIEVATTAQDKALIQTASNKNLCVHLNNKSIMVNGGGYAFYASNNILNIMGKGEVSGTSATYGALRMTGVATVANLYGGTFIRKGNTSVIHYEGWSATCTGALNLYGATNGDGSYGVIVDGNKANYSAPYALIRVRDGYGMTVNMYGGLVKDGKSTGGEGVPGNIQLTNGNGKAPTANSGTVEGDWQDPATGKWYVHKEGFNTFNMYAGLVTGGEATYGGNISGAGSSCWGYGEGPIEGCSHRVQINILGGIVENGTASYGGNIYAHGTEVTVNGGIVTGGTGDNYGANIYLSETNASKTAPAALNLTGDYVDGYISVAADTETKLVGTVNLPGIELRNGAVLDITEMAADSTVGVVASGVFTTERDDIDEFIGCFEVANPAFEEIVKSGNALSCVVNVIAKKNAASQEAANMSFDNYNGELKYCPVCGVNVAWTALTAENCGSTRTLASGHYFLAEDIEVTATGSYLQLTNNGTCLHLNGKDLNVGGNQYALYLKGQVNVMGNGTVVGSHDKGSIRVVLNSTSTTYGPANLYGGTYLRSVYGTTPGAAIVMNSNGQDNGTVLAYLNIYGDPTGNGAYGVIVDGENKESAQGALRWYDCKRTAVAMYGGVIRNCVSTASDTGASVAVAGNTSTFELHGGKITGGTNTRSNAGNISVGNLSVVTIAGGVLENGVCTGSGANIQVIAGGTLNITGGTIKGGQAGYGANINVNNTTDKPTTLNISGGYIYGGVASADRAEKNGANICIGNNVVFNLSGGTIVGDVFVRASTAVTLSGAPKIVKTLELEGGATVNAAFGGLYFESTSGPILTIDDLEATAQLVLSNVAADRVLSDVSDNAANVAGCFTVDGDGLVVVANTDGKLQVAAA